MSGPLLLALAPLLLAVALLLLRLGLYKRHQERILRRLGQALHSVRTGTVRRDWLDPLLQQAGLGNLQLAEEGGFGVRVSGEVAFDDWVKATGTLAAQQVRILRLQADAAGPGRVKLDAVLAHAGGEA